MWKFARGSFLCFNSVMGQSSNDGREANVRGKASARALICKIGGVHCGGNANLFEWEDKCGVMKYGVMKTINAPKNTDIGVYTSMLDCREKPLEIVVAAHWEGKNAYRLCALDVEDFLDNDISRLRPPTKKNAEQRQARWECVEKRSRETRANKRHGIPCRVDI